MQEDAVALSQSFGGIVEKMVSHTCILKMSKLCENQFANGHKFMPVFVTRTCAKRCAKRLNPLLTRGVCNCLYFLRNPFAPFPPRHRHRKIDRGVGGGRWHASCKCILAQELRCKNSAINFGTPIAFLPMSKLAHFVQKARTTPQT